MRKRILIAFATMIGALALTTSSAYAAPSPPAAESTATSNQIVQAGATAVDTQADCHYRVNRAGGIKIYSEPGVNSPIVASLANGATFYALCWNLGKQDLYFDCPELSRLWKSVGNGWVKTGCLVRI